MNSIEWLDIAHRYAQLFSGCKKVQVGAVIVRDNKPIAFGANETYPVSCQSHGCMRVQKYGEASKEYRGPADCRAIHAEIDALASCTTHTVDAVMFITRYPCEACARAIVAAGVRTVVYGRKQEVSDETKAILNAGSVKIIHDKNFIAPDSAL